MSVPKKEQNETEEISRKSESVFGFRKILSDSSSRARENIPQSAHRKSGWGTRVDLKKSVDLVSFED